MIKNIVFDIGNVLVTWNPRVAVARLFPDQDIDHYTRLLFKSDIWFSLNRGEISEDQAIKLMQQHSGVTSEKLLELMREIKKSLLPVENSFDLLHRLHQAQYPLYALSDNVREIVVYLRDKYDFWDKFRGVVISAEVGYLKPAPQIYQHLIDQYQLDPKETVFIDDILKNVEGAQRVGIHGIRFENAKQCESELQKLLAIKK